MEFNFTFDFGSPRLRATRPGRVVEIGERQVLWSAENEPGQWRRLDSAFLPALFACDVFRTDAGHLAELAAFGVPRPVAQAMLDGLARAGILVEPRAMLPAGSDAAVPPPPRIAIRTCRRPTGLRRLLESLVEDEARWGARRDYVVVDDASAADDQRRARDVVADVARGSASSWHYFGGQARAVAMARLATGLEGDARVALQELLDPACPKAPTGARAWNWALLLAAGGTLSILDDDTAFPVCLGGDPDGALEIRDSIRSSIRGFDSVDEIQPPRFDRDVFDYAARVLGRAPATLVGERGWRTDLLEGVRNDRVSFVRPTSRVVAAFTGMYGAFAWDTTVYFSAPEPASLADLLRTPYRHDRFNGDRVTYGAPNLRLVARASYTPLLLDARELLPFAATWGKSDDGFFLAALSAIEPDAIYAYLPALIGHWPEEPRDRLGASMQPLLHDVNNFAGHCVSWYASAMKSADRRTRLVALSAACAELAQSSDAVLGERVARWRHESLDQAVAVHSEALALRPDGPATWRRYVEGMIATNTAAISGDPFAARPLESHRKAVRQVAAAAAAWPEVWARARADGFRAELDPLTAVR